MNGLTYEDIFATKGIEYVLVLGFLLAFVLFMKYLNSPAGWLFAKRTAALSWLDAIGFNFNSETYYSPSHSWLKFTEKGTVSIGVDGFLSRMLGTADKIEIPENGMAVEKGEPLFSIIKGDNKLIVPSPVKGTISDLNVSLSRTPESLDDQTWVLQMQSDTMTRQVASLKRGKKAKSWMAEEFGRLRDFLSTLTSQPSLAGQTLLDGGLPVMGSLEYMDKTIWKKFSDQFLRKEFN